MDETVRSKKDNPYNKASFLSKITFSWITDLIKLGNRKVLDIEDLYDPIDGLTIDVNSDEFEKKWNCEVERLKKTKKQPNIHLVCLKIHLFKLFLYGIIATINEILIFIQPILIVWMIDYFKDKIDLKTALIYCTIISFSIGFVNFSRHFQFLGLQFEGVKMRLGCTGVIYKKIFRLNLNSEKNKKLVGKIINLFASDAHNLDMGFGFVHIFVIYPPVIVACSYMIVKELEVEALCAIPLVAMIFLISSLLGKFNVRFKENSLKMADQRLDLISETLNGIKIIKMFCWENSYKKMVDRFRKIEMKWIGRQYIKMGYNILSEFDFISLVVYACVLSYVFVNPNKPLTTSYVVYVLSYYGILIKKLSALFGHGLKWSMNAYISLNRIKEFLLIDEIKLDENNSKMNYSDNPMIRVSNLNGGWSEEKESFQLKNINMEVSNKELVAIVGSVGSGKSSLLHALLGELPFINDGSINVQGSVFYVPQEPWIFSASIRQNIIFGKPYDPKKFMSIVKACCLDEDLKMFERRDRTIIGEKGINLSGGQRARISLARALYSDAQIYILDDPLSAVDANVAKKLFDNCFNGYLKSKLRVLVTHQIQFLSNVKKIYIVKDGTLEKTNGFQELCALYPSIIDEIQVRYNREFSTESKVSMSSNSVKNMFISNKSIDSIKTVDEKLETPVNNTEYNEQQSSGAIRWSLYYEYFTSGLGLFGAICLFFTCFLAQGLYTFSDFWLARWSARESAIQNNLLVTGNETNFTSTQFHEERKLDFIIYTALIASMFSTAILRLVLLFSIMLRTSNKIHYKMFSQVVCTSMRFFDLNPIGRIMNRFSKDIACVDDILSWQMQDFIILGLQICGSLTLAIIKNYFIGIVLIPLFIGIIFVRKYFLAAAIEIKRIESTCRSPIVSHVTNTLNGLTIIRSAKYEKTVTGEFFSIIDYHSKPFQANWVFQRWFGHKLDLFLTTYIIFVSFSCCLAKDSLKLDAGIVGVILVQIMNIINIFQWAVRLSCEIENLMTSLERIKEYTTLEAEKLESEKKPDADWPKAGHIEFKNVSFRYDKTLPPVLEDLSFSIGSGEKIGVVGRTGAGKSSLIQAIFRIAEPDGDIIIDNVPVKELGLHDLRAHLSIIPQEPTLFAGTIRSNLDPMNQFSDDILWQSLEQVQLKEAVKEMKEGLESEVHKSGSNLSVGQKQLICLARAIIKKSKILVIDEATANVDFKTDHLVQMAIRSCFKDCTVLTIAHRLNTIIDNDKILCLSNGKLEDFAAPYELIQDKSSILSGLMSNLEKAERDKLTEIAKNCYLKKSE